MFSDSTVVAPPVSVIRIQRLFLPPLLANFTLFHPIQAHYIDSQILLTASENSTELARGIETKISESSVLLFQKFQKV